MNIKILNGLKTVALSLVLVMGSCTTDIEEISDETSSLNSTTKMTNYLHEISAIHNSWPINENTRFSTFQSYWASNRKSEDDVLRTYFRTTKSGSINVGVVALMRFSERTVLSVTIDGVTINKEIINGPVNETIDIGEFDLTNAGYHQLDIRIQSVEGAAADADFVGGISGVRIGGEAVASGVTFIDKEFSSHFGRRGPSVHLTYDLPDNQEFTHFYSEISVPENQDVNGSFFMVNGFSNGYFGMQVNSDTERRVLFSVWSPFVTDDPTEISDEDRVTLLARGEGVNTQDFGGEGSGGQSYKVVNWKAGMTYKFLLKGKPVKVNDIDYTDYTAHFYDGETGTWSLIASFRRPKTHEHLESFHSFLENFSPETGNVTRRGNYSNQWVRNAEGTWSRINRATFSIDTTGDEGHRLDYKAGTVGNGNGFYLQNCGFFSDNIIPNAIFTTRTNSSQPNITEAIINYGDNVE